MRAKATLLKRDASAFDQTTPVFVFSFRPKNKRKLVSDFAAYVAPTSKNAESDAAEARSPQT